MTLAIADAKSNEALGVVVLLFRQQDTVDVGYWIIERARQKGVASRAVGLAARWALTDAGLARVEALVEPDNSFPNAFLKASDFSARVTSARIWYSRTDAPMP